jgi:hypothetical protein
LSEAEKAQRFEWIQGAVLDFSGGRALDDVWQEIVGLALPTSPFSEEVR